MYVIDRPEDNSEDNRVMDVEYVQRVAKVRLRELRGRTSRGFMLGELIQLSPIGFDV